VAQAWAVQAWVNQALVEWEWVGLVVEQESVAEAWVVRA
jgi:hypothetical protein